MTITEYIGTPVNANLTDLYIITKDDVSYRVEVRKGRYSPTQRAIQYAVEVFSQDTGNRVGVKSVNSYKRSYTQFAAEDIIERWA